MKKGSKKIINEKKDKKKKEVKKENQRIKRK